MGFVQRWLGSLGAALVLAVPTAVLASPVLYGLDWNTRMLFGIDPGTAQTTPVGSNGLLANSLAFAGDGRLYSTMSGRLGVLDPGTGAASVVNAATGRPRMALAFDSGFGTLYGLDFDNAGQLWRVDPATGTTTLVGSTGLRLASSLAIDSRNQAYVAETFGFAEGGQGRLFRIDLDTGTVLQTVGRIGQGITALAFDDEDRLFGVGLISDDLLRIDTATAVATVIGRLPYGDVRGLAFVPTAPNAVPAPASLALALAALVLAGAAGRRR